jgi:hypothetical protein
MGKLFFWQLLIVGKFTFVIYVVLLIVGNFTFAIYVVVLIVGNFTFPICVVLMIVGNLFVSFHFDHEDHFLPDALQCKCLLSKMYVS